MYSMQPVSGTHSSYIMYFSAIGFDLYNNVFLYPAYCFFIMMMSMIYCIEHNFI